CEFARGQRPAIVRQRARADAGAREQPRVERETLRRRELAGQRDLDVAVGIDAGGNLDGVLRNAITEHRRRDLAARIARVSEELRVERRDARKLVLLAVQRLADRRGVAEARVLEARVDELSRSVQRREQVLAIAEADLAAVVTEREAPSATFGELAGHVEEAPLPDLHDRQQARIEAIVHTELNLTVPGQRRD